MLRILLALFILIIYGMPANSQDNTYFAKEWKKIDSLKQKEFITHSTAQKIEQLLQEAKKVGNKPYLLKAYDATLKHKIFGKYITDNNYTEILSYFDEIKKDHQDITCELIELMEAKILTSYRADKFYTLTQREEYDTTNNITKMNIQQLDEKIIQLYQKIIQSAPVLQKLSAVEYKPILTKSNQPAITPSLLDATAVEMIQQLNQITESQTQPTTYRLTDSSLLNDYSSYTQLSFEHIEDQHIKNVLTLYQSLLKYYQQSANKELLTYIDYERLKYVYQQLSLPNKSIIYYSTLQKSFQQFPQVKFAAWYGLAMADFFYKSGDSYEPFENPAPQFDLVKALEIYKKIDSYFKETTLTNDYIHPYNHIISQQINFVVHPYTQPNKPVLATVTYKNIEKLDIKIYKLENFQLQNIAGQNELHKIVEKLPKKLVRQKSYVLKSFKDYQSHRTDLLIDPLPIGVYYIEYNGMNKTAGTLLNITDLSYVKNENSFLILDQKNGSPVAGAKLRLWKHVWNKQKEDYEYILETTLTSDRNGSVVYTDKKYNSYKIDIQFGNDYYFDYSSTYIGTNSELDREYKSTKLYLDRAIYRPGQTVFFKGISFGKKKQGEPTIAANENVDIEVFDVNDNSVFKQTYTTNKMGSISGEFKLPATTLGGSFYMKAAGFYGTKYFRVEEYKRPKYKFHFEEATNAYQLNDSIQVVGKAMAYAGYPIQNAKVSYTVKRMVRLPRWCYFINPYIRPTEMVVLTTGTAETNDLGEFTVPFKAIPSNTEKQYNPIFDFEISATVTDLSGETHDAYHNIYLGYHKYDVVFGFEENFDLAKLNQFPIAIQNFQGKNQSLNAELKLVGINPPAGVYHQRYQNAPKIDVISIDSIQFKKLFPNEIFYREDEPNRWKENGIKRQVSIQTNEQGWVDLSNQNLQNGWYKMELSIPGVQQKPMAIVQLFSGKPVSMYYEINSKTDKNNYDYGESAKVQFSSNLPSSQQAIFTRYESLTQKDLNFENIQPLIEKDIQLTNKPQSVSLVSALDGRIYKSYQMIYPNNPKQKLSVKVVEKQDTLLPGNQTKFVLQVTGNIEEAELLTGMYDASLDVFSANHWENLLARENNLKVGNWNLPWVNISFDDSYLDKKFSLTDKPLVTLSHFNWLAFLGNTSVRTTMLKSSTRRMDVVQGNVAGLQVQNEMAAPVAFAAKEEEDSVADSEPPQDAIRENFNETAFFFPHVLLDANGKATVEFTIPDALTEWKWMVGVHNTDLGFAYLSDKVVTQKDLMVETNVPRFLRQGDSINYIVKLINVGKENLKATLNYSVEDVLNQTKLTNIFSTPTEIEITVPANSTQTVDLAGVIPMELLEEIVITLQVNTNQPGLKDAVKNVIPILPNSSVITAARNFYFSGNGKYDFSIPELKSTLSASTLSNAPVMVNMNLNPSWEVINALPYIGHVKYESSHEYALQIYANALASKILQDQPSIKENIGLWKKQLEDKESTGTLQDMAFQAISKEQSPWLAEAGNEKAHRAAIVQLFDEQLIKNQIGNALEKLRQLQKLDGGFSWFKGGEISSTYITSNILQLFAELKEFNAIEMDESAMNMINLAVDYLDQSLVKSYRVDSAKYVNESIARYLVLRTSFEKPIPNNVQTYYKAYLQKLYESWDDLSLYGEAKVGLVALKNNNEELSKRILTSLLDRSTKSDTLGMYWKENTSGYYWSQNQLLVQASLIEFFEKMNVDVKTIHLMQQWLLRLKETNRWENAASTANIIKAFFVKNPVDFNHAPSVKVEFNKEKFDFSRQANQAGYIKIYKELDQKSIKKDVVKIDIKNSSDRNMIWGNILWKYQLPFDQIQPNDNELKIQKKIYFQENNVWKEVLAQQVLPVGSKVKIILSIQTDRPMEYIHIQDNRAANMEPVNQMSGYRYSNRVWYYQTIKDASNHFFIDNLPVGNSEIEYECFINQTGSFFNGISTIESFYAPNYRNQSSTIKIDSK